MSVDEILVEVECNNEILVSVDELKRECRDSLQIEGLQRVNFFRGVVGVKKGLHKCIWETYGLQIIVP